VNQIFEAERVLRGISGIVVIEIDVDSLQVLCPSADLFSPFF
jgi:hypothetical protein